MNEKRSLSATAAQRRQRLQSAEIYVIIGAQQSLDRWNRHVQSLVDASVDVIQLRDKKSADRDLLERARRLRKLTCGTSTLFVMNDRPDLASLSEADGVHLGQDELLASDARHILGPDALVGVSTHSLTQARQAVVDGADYIGVGPTFPSTTKHFDAFTGLELLRQVASKISLPAFAIGGINLDNLASVLATGFRRVAVSGMIEAAEDPLAVVREIRELLVQCAANRNETSNT
jgi:thiamine-phosphate pyrophosphorylase